MSIAERPAGAPLRVLVAGSGIAGLTAALHAARQPGARVTLVTKDVLEHANTRFAQGGIAGVMFDDDRAQDHVRDTMVAGAWLNDPAAVRLLVAEGPERIRELSALGVAFDREADGTYVKGLEAAHSYPRILHAGGDATGSAIERALVAELRRHAVEVIEHAFVVDLVLRDGRVAGAELLLDDERHLVLEADAVVLATGGLGELYAHSTNPPVATGDGIAVAMRAGAEVAELEFVQFHPTVLAAGEAFLVSEAVRGEGAVLIDDEGRRFAFDHHPDGELAPRDVLARAIAGRMAEQGGRPVRLDATGLGRAFLAERFPTIDAAVRARGLDWAAEPIPVTPAAHYLMGGVVTDLDGRTTVPGLYAVGEVARTGVHGANRLASNSLLEGAVFGARAGEALGRDAGSASWAFPATERRQHARGQAIAGDERLVSGIPPVFGTPDGDRAAAGATPGAPFSRAALQELMWREAGLVRHGDGLRRAAAQLAAWRATAIPPTTEAEHEDANLLQIGIALVDAALARTESVGAHHRADSTNATPASPARRAAPGASVAHVAAERAVSATRARGPHLAPEPLEPAR